MIAICLCAVVATGCANRNISQGNGKITETHQARSAHEFLNSIGVNTAIYRRGENLEKTIECISYIGARWIRTDEYMDTPQQEETISELHKRTGVLISTSLGSGGSDIARLIKGSRRMAEIGALLAIEGNNEPNNWGIKYQGQEGGKDKSWAPVARLHRDLYKAVKADDVLRNYPVWGTTETGAMTDNVGMQYLSVPADEPHVDSEFQNATFADVLNCHNYFTHPSWPPLQNNQTWLSSSPTDNARGDHLYGNYGNTWGKHYKGYTAEQLRKLPRVTTETGATIGGALTEEMQARLYMSCYLAQFAQGWSHTAMYILRDRSDEAGNQTFGFYTANYEPRQAAHYLHRMTTILSDNKAPKKLETLNYSISNQPEAVHDLLLQKSDGTFALIIWGELYAGGEENITVNFARTHNTITVYDPTKGTAPINTLNKTNSIPLKMTTHPYILMVK